MKDLIMVLPEGIASPQPSVEMARYEGKVAYLSADIEWSENAYIVGSWDSETGLRYGQTYDAEGGVIGTPEHAIHPDYLEFINPLGNRAGQATGHLDTLRWQGHPEAKFLQDDRRYPDTDAPFQLKIERVYHDGTDPTFTIEGWGWTVTMISADPVRDITARGIGVYSDPECTQYLYTTGAFINENGTYLTRCPSGQVQPTDAQVNFALLLGSAQEGFFNLPAGSSTTEALFWSKDQGATVDEWPEWVQPTGAQDAYLLGAQVSHNGFHWINTGSNANVWEPGVFGWVKQ